MGNVLIDGFELSEDNFGNLMVFAAGGVGSDSYEMICREDVVLTEENVEVY